MNKKQQSSNKRRKRASIGLAVCFAAAIVLTGAYTWRNYRANVKDEQAKIEEEQQAKEEEIKRNTEETSSIAKKALEDEEPVTKRGQPGRKYGKEMEVQRTGWIHGRRTARRPQERQ